MQTWSLVGAFLLSACAVDAAWSPYRPKRTMQASNPIAYERYVRRRPPVYSDETEVFEVREVYYEPKPKQHRIQNARLLTDDEIDMIITCDFEPWRLGCKSLQKDFAKSTTAKPFSRPFDTTKNPLMITTLKTIKATTTTTPKPRPQPEPEPVTSTELTTTTTTTDLPFLPELKFSEEETDEPAPERVTESQELDPDDYTDNEENEDVDDKNKRGNADIGNDGYDENKEGNDIATTDDTEAVTEDALDAGESLFAEEEPEAVEDEEEENDEDIDNAIDEDYENESNGAMGLLDLTD